MDELAEALKGNITTNYYIKPQDLLIEALLLPKRLVQRGIINNTLNNYINENNVPYENKNALRHRGGSALMSNMLESGNKARLWGNIKEISDSITRKEDDTFTDLANNELGRRIWDNNRGLPNSVLLDIVYSDIENIPIPPLFEDTPKFKKLWDILNK